MPSPHKTWRSTYVNHTQQEIEAAFAVSNQVQVDWWEQIVRMAVNGANEFERGRAEGRRELAGQQLAMAKGLIESAVETIPSVRRNRGT